MLFWPGGFWLGGLFRAETGGWTVVPKWCDPAGFFASVLTGLAGAGLAGVGLWTAGTGWRTGG